VTVWQRLLARQPVESERRARGPALRRALGAPALIAIGLGTMLGGIFATIGSATQAAGPGVIESFLLSGAACFFVALCYSELASMVPIAGSAYTYAYATLGEFVAWVIGWDLILEYGISVAPLASSCSGYFQGLLTSAGLKLPGWATTANLAFNGLRPDLAHSQIDVVAIVITLAVTLLLAIGIRESASANLTMVVVQIVAMVAFIAGLLGAIHPGNFQPAFPTGLQGVVTGAALAFFAYIGFDTVTVASEEAHRPERDVPLGIIGSLVIGAILYIAIAWVTVGVAPWQHIDKDAGMLDAIKHAGNNPILSLIVSVGAIAGLTATMLTSLLGQIRIFYVMARDRMLPPWVANVHEKTRTPVGTTIVVGILVAILAGVLPITQGINFVNIGTLSAFAIVCAGVLVLRFTQPNARRPFRAPLGPLVAIAGAGLCLYLMIGGLSGWTWLRFIGWLAVGLVIYIIYGYRHSLLRPGNAEKG
jgi:APA family basic amino acid/polyamine antiporter